MPNPQREIGSPGQNLSQMKTYVVPVLRFLNIGNMYFSLLQVLPSTSFDLTVDTVTAFF